MKKILICVPVMESVNTDFFASFTGLKRVEECHVTLTKDTLIYNARNVMAATALERGFDYIFWLDSDMVFPPDTLERLFRTAEEKNLDFIAGMYFKRTSPTVPVVLKALEWEQLPTGEIKHRCDFYMDYPRNSLFEVAGAGTGCLLTRVDVYRKVIQRFGVAPFQPLPSFGEDYSFCWRAAQCGVKFWCDSSLNIGHSGRWIFNEQMYLEEQAKNSTTNAEE